MKVAYRKLFLKDLQKLKRQPVYKLVYKLAFETIPKAQSLEELPSIKALSGTTNRYRLRVGSYRIGIETTEQGVELFRVLHRREFYRYFP
ncbi:type II toxin-antitoxin system RelE/ParE family toxin [cf. Phormidesmis sp. LEGE 11477]|uniref:type II toxin-antitoxin system RelE family toxin n=1 Tax=cf. Phormidesmis sp. LEGE 11477 TaxID=1828680 RepID=UPI0018818D01|nr:type II toxin-antitoxin system RelE/ParE family toxin [cf. Phormidesmis sp. LEGE 11477]MBE9061726.1 type II toxin-antitoxin system RelE/ParE family toxin [cf. Phormidesmis sp. LEGE 11477]